MKVPIKIRSINPVAAEIAGYINVELLHQGDCTSSSNGAYSTSKYTKWIMTQYGMLLLYMYVFVVLAEY